jgi:acyl-coenzyme A synthetase/AMP-(fatty) acid ligase
MPTIPQSIQTLFNDHQARLDAVAAASGVVGLSLDLDQISAAYLSKAVQTLVRPKYAADANAGKSPEEKISKLASSVSRLAKQVRSLAPNDAFYSAFTSGSVAAAQDVFLSIFGLTMPS